MKLTIEKCIDYIKTLKLKCDNYNINIIINNVSTIAK